MKRRVIAAVIAVAVCLAFRAPAQYYSLNALGYADVDFVAGSNLVANPFNAGDNTISNLFRGVPDGAMFLPGHGGADYSFQPTNLFRSASGWTAPGDTLVAPNGGFLWLPSPTRITFVGDPSWPVLTLTSGSTRWEVLDRFPEVWPPIFCVSFTDPCPQSEVPDGTMLQKWNKTIQQWDTFYFTSFLPGIEPAIWFPYQPQFDLAEAGVFFIPEPPPIRVWTRGGGLDRTGVTLSRAECRDGQMTFRFASASSNTFAVLRSTNVAASTWHVVQHGTNTSPLASVTVPMASSLEGAEFYRLEPAFGSYVALMHPVRTNSTFSFEFHAPATTAYSIRRKARLSDPTWQQVGTVGASENTVVRYTDSGATAATGYYLVVQMPSP